MNLIKSISNQYKKSIHNFIFNSINKINNKRNNESCHGIIINNNTYNTTLNIFTENKQKNNNINNINQIKNKKHLRTNSVCKKIIRLFMNNYFIKKIK